MRHLLRSNGPPGTPRLAGTSWLRPRVVLTGLLAVLATAGTAGAAPSQADPCLPFLPETILSCTPPTTGPTPTTPPTTPTPTTSPVLAVPAALPPAPSPAASVQAGADSAGASQLLDLVNQSRAQAGLGPLAMRSDVVDIALGHSRDMATQNRLYHNDGLFSSTIRSLLAAGALGENVDMDFSVQAIHNAFMASPHHRANVLDGRFTVAGFAIVVDGSGSYWATEDFVQAKGSPQQARSAPAPRAAVAASPPPTSGHPVTTSAPAPAPAAAPAPVTAPTTSPVPSTLSPVVVGPPSSVELSIAQPAARHHTPVGPPEAAGVAALALLALVGGRAVFAGGVSRRAAPLRWL
jgi:uncharacterized protein YkwD